MITNKSLRSHITLQSSGKLLLIVKLTLFDQQTLWLNIKIDKRFRIQGVKTFNLKTLMPLSDQTNRTRGTSFCHASQHVNYTRDSLHFDSNFCINCFKV